MNGDYPKSNKSKFLNDLKCSHAIRKGNVSLKDFERFTGLWNFHILFETNFFVLRGLKISKIGSRDFRLYSNSFPSSLFHHVSLSLYFNFSAPTPPIIFRISRKLSHAARTSVREIRNDFESNGTIKCSICCVFDTPNWGQELLSSRWCFVALADRYFRFFTDARTAAHPPSVESRANLQSNQYHL